jgi:A/G-specific adenine glycosylase
MTFALQLLSWYQKNKRDLPWRNTKDPYLIWLSEIIMQQTRIIQGTPYYTRFAKTWPTVALLAAADEQEVLRMWQGLGYYSRARNLHEAARMIVKDYNGQFPDTYSGIRRLKGIGDYTAAAIASVCFGLPYAVMDGNVLRFISRLYGMEGSIDLPENKKKIHSIVTEHIDHHNPGDYNQALMEFGAMVCTPANPDCLNCVFKTRCIAFINNITDSIPARSVKVKVRHRYPHYLVLTVTVRGKEFIYLNKRTGKEIWRNLYDFPSLEYPDDKRNSQLQPDEFNVFTNEILPGISEVSEPYVHVLTHQKLHARFYRFHSDTMVKLSYPLIPLEDIQKYPLPRLIHRYLLQNNLVGD